jgi:hypothetical protein
MRVGRRANTAIGRFVRLFLRNVAGLRIPPGDTDMCAIGQGLLPAMAENDAAATQIGWPSLRVQWGLDAGDTAVAVQGVIGTSLPIYTAGGESDPHLRRLGEAVAGCSLPAAGLARMFGRGSPVLAISPEIAALFARDGMTPGDVAVAVSEHALAAVDEVEALLEGAIGRRLTEPEQAMIRDGDRHAQRVPVLPDPSALALVLTGEPGRNQSKYYAPVGIAGARVVRRTERSPT